MSVFLYAAKHFDEHGGEKKRLDEQGFSPEDIKEIKEVWTGFKSAQEMYRAAEYEYNNVWKPICRILLSFNRHKKDQSKFDNFIQTYKEYCNKKF